MKESDAKKKICPYIGQMHSTMMVGQTAAVTESPQTKADINLYKEAMSLLDCKCLGSGCMMWESWDRRERTATQNWQGGDPPAPKGDDWQALGEATRISSHPDNPTTQQKWVRSVPTGEGTCGLISKDGT